MGVPQYEFPFVQALEKDVTEERRFTFVHSSDRAIHGVYVYVSLFAANVTQATTAFLPGTRRVYNFKRHGRGRAWVRSAVEQAASDYDCDSIVVVPGSTPQETQLQKLFGVTIRRTKPVHRRKYNHSSQIPPEYTASLFFPEEIGRRPLLVDDVCTSGKTLEWFRSHLQDRGHDVVLFCLGLNRKLAVPRVAVGTSERTGVHLPGLGCVQGSCPVCSV